MRFSKVACRPFAETRSCQPSRSSWHSSAALKKASCTCFAQLHLRDGRAEVERRFRGGRSAMDLDHTRTCHLPAGSGGTVQVTEVADQAVGAHWKLSPGSAAQPRVTWPGSAPKTVPMMVSESFAAVAVKDVIVGDCAAEASVTLPAMSWKRSRWMQVPEGTGGNVAQPPWDGRVYTR